MADPIPFGAFCWPELGTPDLAAAQAFYTALFGWEAEVAPTSGGDYVTWRLAGASVGGAWQLPPEMIQQGIPPHWLSYAKVADVDQAAAQTRALGGEVRMGPCDVMDLGRNLVIADPEGAVLALWQPGSHPGFETSGEPGSLCWTELMARRPGDAKAFYGGLLGWEARDRTDLGFTYTEWYVGETPVGGMMPMEGPEWGDLGAHWMPYFAVTDPDACAAQAQALGGSCCVAPQDIPGVGRFAVLGDPEGAFFSVIRLDGPSA